MAGNLGSVYMSVRADDRKLPGDLNKTKRMVAQAAVKMEQSLNKAFKVMGVAAMAGAAAATYALQKVGREALQVAKTQEAVERRLEAVIKATGQAAGYNINQLKDMASAMQKVTTVGDEVTLSGMAILATFKNIRGDAFERTTKAALDMSEVMQQDVKSSMIMISKAMNDPIANLSAMTRAGVQFTKVQKEMIKELWETGKQMEAQNIILEEMESQFGGAAEAARLHFAGMSDAASNAYGDMLEEVGYLITKNETFINVLEVAEKTFIRWTGYIEANSVELKAALSKAWEAGLAKMPDYIEGLKKIVVLAFAVSGAFEGWVMTFKAIKVAWLDYIQLPLMKGHRLLQKGVEKLLKLYSYIPVLGKLVKPVLSEVTELINAQNGAIDLVEKSLGKAEAELSDAVKNPNWQKGLDVIRGLEAAILKLRTAAILAGNEGEELSAAYAGIGGTDSIFITPTGFQDFSENLVLSVEEGTDKAEEIYSHFMGNIHDATADTFYDIFTGQIKNFGDFVDSMKDLFLRGLAEMCAAAMTKTIIVPVIAAAAGVAGDAVSSATGGVGISDLLSLGSQGYNLLSGGGGMLSAAMWDQTIMTSLTSGANMGAMYTPGILDSVLGGITPSMLAGPLAGALPFALTGDIGSCVGTYLGANVGGAFFGPLGAMAGSALGGIFGSMFGGEDKPHKFRGQMFGDANLYTGTGGASLIGFGRGENMYREYREQAGAQLSSAFNARIDAMSTMLQELDEQIEFDIADFMSEQGAFSFEGTRFGTRGHINQALEVHAEELMTALDEYIIETLGPIIQQGVTQEILTSANVQALMGTSILSGYMGGQVSADSGYSDIIRQINELSNVEDIGVEQLSQLMELLNFAEQFAAQFTATWEGIQWEMGLGAATDLEIAIRNVNQQYDNYIATMTSLGAAESVLAEIEAGRADAIDALTEASEAAAQAELDRLADTWSGIQWDMGVDSATDLEIAMHRLNEQYDNYIDTMTELGASEAILAEIEAGRIDAINALTEANEAATQAELDRIAAQEAAELSRIQAGASGLGESLMSQLLKLTLSPQEFGLWQINQTYADTLEQIQAWAEETGEGYEDLLALAEQVKDEQLEALDAQLEAASAQSEAAISQVQAAQDVTNSIQAWKSIADGLASSILSLQFGTVNPASLESQMSAMKTKWAFWGGGDSPTGFLNSLSEGERQSEIKKMQSFLMSYNSMAQSTFQRPSTEYGTTYDWVLNELGKLEEYAQTHINELDVQLSMLGELQTIRESLADLQVNVNVAVTGAGGTGSGTGGTGGGGTGGTGGAGGSGDPATPWEGSSIYSAWNGLFTAGNVGQSISQWGGTFTFRQMPGWVEGLYTNNYGAAGVGPGTLMSLYNSNAGFQQAIDSSFGTPYAMGGLVNSPTRALIGEAGPEAVIPLLGGAVPVDIRGGSTGENSYNFVFNISAPDAHKAGKAVRKEIEGFFRSNMGRKIIQETSIGR